MSTPQHDLDRFFSGTTGDKLLEMEQVFTDHGPALLARHDVTESLARINLLAGRLDSTMASMNLGILCSRCASTQGGGCCSSYMEANTDVILLLMNRLLGSRVQRQHAPSNECCFLGDKGCTLPVKPMFCLNYNCSHIHEAVGDTRMAALEFPAGQLLTEQTRLEALILQALG